MNSLPDECTFTAADFFTDEPQDIGRLLLEVDGVRWVLLACRAASTGGVWMGTWCGVEYERAARLPFLELGPGLVARLEAAERVDILTGETEAA